MGDKSRIEWTEATWNPTTGCDRVSPGCDHCYAMSLAPRLKAMGSKRYQRDGDPRTSGPGFGLTLHSETLGLPMRWTKPRRIFVNSMSDLFHDEVPDRFIADVFAVMTIAERHTFQLLTKRHGRMRSLLTSVRFWRDVSTARNVRGSDSLPYTGAGGFEPPSNVWLGVSVEDQKRADIRIPALLETPAAVRWLSMEPLLGPVDLFGDVEAPGPAAIREGYSYRTDYGTGIEYDFDDQPGIDWVVVGGESGRGARPMHPKWAWSLRDQCTGAGVPFFFKQWGGRTPKANGRELDGRTWDEYPDGDR